jgi:hypothetical protein
MSTPLKSRRPATARLALRAMRTPMTPETLPYNQFRRKLNEGLQQAIEETNRQVSAYNVAGRYVQKLRNRAKNTKKRKVINNETGRGVRIVANRVGFLYNHYGIKPGTLKTNVERVVTNDYINMMQKGVHNTNNAAVRRLIYKINTAVPPKFHTTKQSRFKKFFTRPSENGRPRRLQSAAHVVGAVGELFRAFTR